MRWRALAVLLAAASAVAEAPRDPWTSGASVEPWPFIARLQRWGTADEKEPDWTAAARHADPLVRAAAAAALGRRPDPKRRAVLDALLTDRVPVVRDAAHWAVLQFPDEPTSAVVRGLADELRRYVDRLRRYVPPRVWQLDRGGHRAWARALPPGSLSPIPAEPAYEAQRERLEVMALQTEVDSDAIVELVVRVVTTAGQVGGATRLQASLVPHDPWSPPRERSAGVPAPAPSPEPISLRVVGGDGTGNLVLPPSSDRTVRVSFDLAEVPPDIYTLTLGNPLFFRVRRSVDAEARGGAAARDVLKTEDALRTVARLRMASAFDALRERFSKSLAAYGFGFNAWRDALVLERLADPRAADLVLPPLLAARTFRDPWTSAPPDLVHLLTVGFGGAGRARLDTFAERWRESLGTEHGEVLSRLLGDPSYGPGTAVDKARLEVIDDLGPRLSAKERSVDTYQDERLFEAAMAGAARHHPSEVAAHLVRMAARPAEVGQRLQTLAGPLSMGEGDRLVAAVMQALPPPPTGAPDDARAAAAAAAEALGLETPAAAPDRVSAGELDRQLVAALSGWGTSPSRMERALVLARAVLERESAPVLATHAAELEMMRGRWEEAARLVADPATLPTKGDYGPSPAQRAHGILGRVAAARGDLPRAAAELKEAGAISGVGHEDFTKTLAERIAVIGVTPPASVRFLPRSVVPRAAWNAAQASRGSVAFSVDEEGRVQSLDVRAGTTREIGRLPGPARALAAISETAVVAAGTDAAWRLDAGRAAPAWTVQLTAKSARGRDLLDANAVTTTVSDGDLFRAWSTASPERARWERRCVARHALLPDGDVMLVRKQDATCENDRSAVLERVDAKTGVASWSVHLPGVPGLWSVGGGLVVLWGAKDVMTAYSAKDGRPLWTRDFHQPNRWLTGNNVAAFVAAADGRRVYVRVDTTVQGLSGEDGSTLWTRAFAMDDVESTVGYLSDQALVPVPDGSVWWLGRLATPQRVHAARLLGADGTVRLNPPVPADNAPTILEDGTVVMPPTYGSFLEIWSPR
jgi:hypothetical protein